MLRKITVLLMALVMTVAMSVPAFAAEEGMHDISFSFNNISEEEQTNRITIEKRNNGMMSFWEDPDPEMFEDDYEAPRFEVRIKGYQEADQKLEEGSYFSNGRIVAMDSASEYDITSIKINGVDYITRIQKPWSKTPTSLNYYPIPVPEEIATFYDPVMENYVGAPVTIRFNNDSTFRLLFDSFKGSEDIHVEIGFAGKEETTVDESKSDNPGTEEKKPAVVKKPSVAKKANPLTVKTNKIKVKRKKIKKKAQTFAMKKVFTLSKAKGKVSFKIVKKDKRLKNKVSITKNGTIKVKKGLRKGAYKLHIMVQASGDSKYMPGSKTVVVPIRVK